MTIIKDLKVRLAWLMSFFTTKPVMTGQGLTTTDDSLPEKKLPERKPGLVRYYADSEQEYTVVGHYMVTGRCTVRLMSTDTNEFFELDEELFKKLFKLI